MNIGDILKSKDMGISFEFFPPGTGEGRRELLQVAQTLSKYSPMYVSVTYGAGGSTQDRTKKTLYLLKEETDLNLMSHLTCIGATREAMDILLKEYIEHGIDNILALRGDPPQDVEGFDFTKSEFHYARDLVRFIKKYERFGIAVAVYPEGHQEAPSLEADLEYTKMKVDEGADFAITQMFFDNRYFYDFLDRARQKGIDIPILPGIMPITDFAKIKKFASFCRATIPEEIEERMSNLADSPEDMKKAGLEITVKQCKDLLESGIRYLHFYTLNRADAVNAIMDAL
ncbi:MAG: methylenetetrahydrofolate reductase [NAD(P)H] [Deferribacteres bacterium]|nr:methylenetetrahydrofolate reductase [NAD(P)H] [Deferribacteres bacterium]